MLPMLDRIIASLREVSDGLGGAGADGAGMPPEELRGRYIDAPLWPWFAAGCVVGTLVVLLFLVAWMSGRA